jgi:hypothetical protein
MLMRRSGSSREQLKRHGAPEKIILDDYVAAHTAVDGLKTEITQQVRSVPRRGVGLEWAGKITHA